MRDAQLADIVLPTQLATERKTYRTLGTAPVNPPGKPARYATVVAEYAGGGGSEARHDYRYGRLSVAGRRVHRMGVESSIRTRTVQRRLSNWYHRPTSRCAGRAAGGGLTDRLHADQNATPMTYTQGPEKHAFGPGWCGV